MEYSEYKRIILLWTLSFDINRIGDYVIVDMLYGARLTNLRYSNESFAIMSSYNRIVMDVRILCNHIESDK